MMKRQLPLAPLILMLLAAEPANPMRIRPQRPILISGPINENQLVVLRGNVRPEATRINDRGPVPDEVRLNQLFLLLRRPAAEEQALDQFINQLTDPKSPNYHHWLTAQQLGNEYGLAQQDLDTISNWLESYGFRVNEVYPNDIVIDFSGNVGQVRRAFHTEIHYLDVHGVRHFANMSDPKIPAGLAPAIAGIVSLNDFMPQPNVQMRPQYSVSGTYGLSSTPELVVPADLEKIYNFTPTYNTGYSGQGQTVVVLEDTDVYSTSDWSTFRSTFGLASSYPTGNFTQIHPPSSGTNNCTDPGVVTAHEGEAIIDAEWASAATPSATIELASCADTTNFGGFIALQNILNAAGTPPAVVSISYGEAEAVLGASSNAAVDSLYQQAASEGVSVFVSAGDAGADVEDQNMTTATHGINVSGFASTPYNVAVGGTDFGDTYAGTNSTYWNTTNSSTYESALSYIPEIPWNNSCGSALIATYLGFSGVPYGSSGLCNSTTATSDGLINTGAGSGGPSSVYSKPSWQSVYGNPSDSVRDLPDVSLFASDGEWGHAYVFCWSDTANGGKSCAGAPYTWSLAGGTSFAAPIMAGIQALVNQATRSRAGNPNPSFYSLAKTEYGTSGSTACNSSKGNTAGASCIFYDVTQGDMDVPCTGTNNCYLPSGTYGVLSTSGSAYQPAYAAGTGWDFATGIGTVNVTNLVNALATGEASFSPPSVGFAPQSIGTTSAAQTVILADTGLGPLAITGITISGADTGAFSENDNCPRSPTTLAVSANCTLQLSFVPDAAGPLKSSVSVADNAGNSPQSIVLTGAGSAFSLSPAGLTFASQTVGTSSPSMSVTLTNAGSATVNLWQIAILGADAGDFSETTTCGATLAASANCSVNVTFKPTATGARTATLDFSDSAGGSPQSAPLSGTGQ